MRIPIACSLTADAQHGRVAEWRSFLAASVASARREGMTLRCDLVPTDEVLVAAVDLASREKQCCEFFSFTLEIHAASRTLVIEVPAEAVGILDDFIELLPPRGT